MNYRKNEKPKLWFRSARIFRSDSYWYFHTREGINVGPYATAFEAEVESCILKNLLKQCASGKQLEVIRGFQFDSITLSAGLNEAVFTDYLLNEGHF